jgi:hypothetical protein
LRRSIYGISALPISRLGVLSSAYSVFGKPYLELDDLDFEFEMEEEE